MGQEEYNACIAAKGSHETCKYLMEEDEGETGKITSLSQLVNNQLFDLTRGGAPVRVRAIRLSGRKGPGGYNLEDVETGQRYFAANRILVDTLGYAYEVSPGGDVNTGNPIRSRMLSQSERNAAVSAGIPLLGVPSTGTSRAAPAYGSTQPGIEQQQTWETGEREAGQEWEAGQVGEQRTWQEEQDRLAREASERDAEAARQNQRRIALQGDLRALSQTAASVRQQYRSDLMGLEQTMKLILGETLGKDVVRGAIMSTGQVQRGVTPMGAFRTDVRGVGTSAGQLAGELESPLPTPNLGAGIPGLEAQMPQYEEWQTPPDLPQLPTGPVFGLLHGGEVAKGGKEKGQITPFAERPDPRTSLQYAEQMGLTPRIVGEREGGPELALLAPGSKVIPLSDEEEVGLLPLVQGAAEGVDLPYDPSTLEQALAPIYGHLGFSTMPRVSPGAGGAMNLRRGGATTRGALGRLGIQPRLIRTEGGGVFFVDPSGKPRLVPSGEAFKEYGFNWSDVVNMPGRQMRGMYPERGSPLTEAPPLIESGVSERRFPSPAGLITAPLSLEEGAPGFALPAMRTIANLWGDLSPAVQDVIESAFGVANITPATMAAEMRFFTPRGTATAPGAALIA